MKTYLLLYNDGPPSVRMKLAVRDTNAGATVAEINAMIGVDHEDVIPAGSTFDPIAHAQTQYNRWLNEQQANRRIA